MNPDEEIAFDAGYAAAIEHSLNMLNRLMSSSSSGEGCAELARAAGYIQRLHPAYSAAAAAGKSPRGITGASS